MKISSEKSFISGDNNKTKQNFRSSLKSKMFSKKKKKIDISAPSNFQHRVHTGFDNSSNKFVGLPKQWASLVDDKPASASPHRPSPFIDPSIITPTDSIEVQVRNVCLKLFGGGCGSVGRVVSSSAGRI